MNLPFPKLSIIPRFYLVLCFLFTISFYANSQNWQIDILKKLALYQKVNHQEKIFIQTDRPVYLPGETIWFNAFVMNAVSQQLNNTEVVLHVELLKPDRTIYAKEMFKINEGIASGQLDVKPNAPVGTYYLVAYTNWMRNSGSEFYFSKEIIINDIPGNSGSSSSVNKVTDERRKVPSVSDQSEEEGLNIQFYPEGGDLLAGVSSKVAFEVCDSMGMPQNFMGVVENSKGEFVAAANTLWRGKGFFMIMPEAGQSYYLKSMEQESVRLKYSLPDVKDSGLAMSVVERGSAINLSVSRNGEADVDTSLFVLAAQNGKAVNAMKLNLTGRQQLTVQFDKSEFNSGIVQFTLFDSNKMPRCERLFFLKREGALAISIVENKLPHESRDNVNLGINVSNSTGEPVEGVFSISVTDAKRVDSRNYRVPDMVNYMTLSSDLPHFKIYDPVLFQNTREAAMKTELLMLTNGWRRYRWEEVLADTLIMPTYLEEPGIYVQGEVRSPWGKEKVPKGAAVSMVAGSVFDSYSEEVNDEGRFTFIMRDFYDTKNVVFQTKNKRDSQRDYKLYIKSNYQPQAVDQYAYLKAAWNNTSDDLLTDKPMLQPEVLRKQLMRVVQEDTFVVRTDKVIGDVDITAESKKSPKGQMTDKYGSPEYSVGESSIEELVEEQPWCDGLFSLMYDAFPNMRVTVDYDSATSARIIFKLLGKPRHRFYVFIDGRMVGASNLRGEMKGELGTYRVEDLVTMDPKEIKSIDLLIPNEYKAQSSLTEDYRFYSEEQPDLGTFDGVMAFMEEGVDAIATPTAIISIYTQSGGGLFSTTAYKGMSNVTLHGYKRVKEFYNVDYSTALKDSVIADARNTLAWFPQIKTDANGKAQVQFYASDVSDKIRLEINGVSKYGELGSLMYYSADSLFSHQPIKTEEIERSEVSGQLAGRPVLIISPDVPAAYARIGLDDGSWSTYSSGTGLFLIDTNRIDAYSTLHIDKPGYQTLICSYSELISGNQTMHKKPYDKSDGDVQEIMKQVYRNRIKNRYSKKAFFKGAYREKLFDNNHLHMVSDYAFIQSWPNIAETTLPIVTKITGGQMNQSADADQKIPFQPVKRGGTIPLIDPVWELQSFVNSKFQK
nr:MG2 domain-containing protein [uncultured Carboxylicivirga sp.]